MSLKTSTVGSWPPIDEPDESTQSLYPEAQELAVQQSIEAAIQEQLSLGIDILVDGQVRDDVVSMFVSKLPGYAEAGHIYQVVERIQPSDEPITLKDYLYAKQFAGGRPLKAHVTGPMTLARATHVDVESPYKDRNDRALVLDLAEALGHECRYLVQAGAEIVQIDEPALADGVEIELAFEAMKLIIEIGEIPIPALHICKNVSRILGDVLTKSPVKIVSMEGEWLRYEPLRYVDKRYLLACGKQIGLGCIEVRKYEIEKPTALLSMLDLMVARLGEDGIWAVMPNCGFRLVPRQVVQNKLKVMVNATKALYH